ncbi:hypothetical protein KAH37_06660 [bacterium]|nr:hypothetical protein [bacterium]
MRSFILLTILFTTVSLFSAEVRSLPDETHPETYYMSGDELHTFLQNLADKHPEATLSTIGQSWEKRDIYSLEIGNPDAPAVFVVGLHHAREWISLEMTAHFAAFLLENRENNSDIDNLLNHVDFHFIPLLNPDGYLFSREENRHWRNNRHLFDDGHIGVDLNRNYDAAWVYNDEHLHGEAPFSEPETTALKELIEKKMQTGEVAGFFSYHSYSQLILFPPGSTETPYADVDMMLSTGETMAKIIKKECGRAYTVKQIFYLYPVFGGASEWFHDVTGAPAFTIELPPAAGDPQGFKLLADDIQSVLYEQTGAALYAVERMIAGEDVSYDDNNNGILNWYENTAWENLSCDSENEDSDDERSEGDSDTKTDGDIEIIDYYDEDIAFDSESTPALSGCSLLIFL